MVTFACAPAAAQGDPCAPPVENEVACENSLPGADGWEINLHGSPTIQGYATRMSVEPGDTIDFKIKSETSDFRIDVLRLGYYGGDGARRLADDLAPTGPSTQPECLTDSDTGLIDCGNWSVTRSWTVPSDAVSGVYIAHLFRNDGGGESHIVFVVRDESSDADIVVQTSDTTWQAYNDYGGNSLYRCAVACPPGNPLAYKAAYEVSYNRPFNTSSEESWLMTGGEYPLIRFLERNGYDVSYLSGVDAHRRGSLLQNHDLFVSVGHDEYWSPTQRSSMEAARAAGVNLAFLSGNEGYWKTRWKPGVDGTPDRTMVSYKDTHFDAPTDPVTWTGTWTDPRFTTLADGVTPQNALTGQLFVVNSGTSHITVPHEYGDLRMWRDTEVAELGPGESLALAPNTLGYEWDVDADNGFRPAGQFRLSSTTASGVEVFTDYGSTTEFGQTETHNLTMYRAPSGALVFGAGTVQWSFGLDGFNELSSEDPNMQQATVNLLADMGAQPATPQAAVTPASPSSDASAPTSTIDTLPATVQDGDEITITGSASDSGGGVVAGVEVSTDGGESWRRAEGTTSWSYTWVAHGSPSTTIRSRAVDDSANLERPGAGVAIDVACPCSLWGPSVGPAEPDGGDGQSVEAGVKFKAKVYGAVSGIRFYKAATNTGTHRGTLWTAAGEQLAQATFANESDSGWQTVTFDEPVPVTPGTTYVASYHAPNGHYSATPNYFHRAPAPLPQGGATVAAGPLELVTGPGSANGLYAYAPSSTFPVNSFQATNYWVDVVFEPLPAPGEVTGVEAVEGGPTSANVSWSEPADGGPPSEYEITPYVGATPQQPTVVSGSPPEPHAQVTGLTTGETYTFRVRALNPAGSGPQSAPSDPVTPLTIVAPTAPGDVLARPGSNAAKVSWTEPYSDGESAITEYTVTPYVDGQAQAPVDVPAAQTSAVVTGLTNGKSYTFKVSATNAAGTSPESAASAPVAPQATILDFATPPTVDGGDPDAVELGVKFRSDVAGEVTGVRFFKATTSTGTHVGSLWTAGGVRLAQATFTGESDSGWQAVTFDEPVPIEADTTYVASYFAPEGHYSIAPGALEETGIDNPPLHALSLDESENGVYAYAATSSFPTKAFNASNYYVDVLFAVPQPGQVTGVGATAGNESATVSWSAPSGGGPVDSYEVTPWVGSTPQEPTTVSGSPLETSARVIGLTAGTEYTFTVAAGNANGLGPDSAHSNAVTPDVAAPPSAPTDVFARPASSMARVHWAEPANDGGRPITAYTVTPLVGGEPQTPVEVDGSETSATITDLVDGTSYAFAVTATNEIGTGAASAPSAPVTPQRTILDFTPPALVDSGDPSSVELGVKFQADVVGEVTGVRFFKAPANTGTHVGSLWTAGGVRLAEATFTDESDSGWQAVTFDEPVPVEPGTTYVASYFAPNGHYSATGAAFAASGVDNPPLHALANATSSNGVYRYGPASSFPTSSYNAASYLVDVLFAPEQPPGPVTDLTATAAPTSAELSWSEPSGGPVTAYEITPYVESTPQAPITVTGSPPATEEIVTGLTPGTAYTFTVRASGPGGEGPESAHSNEVTPTEAAVPTAPTDVLARPASSSALVSWTPPANDGGEPVTGYTVTPHVDGQSQAPVEVDAPDTSAIVGGLDDGTAYEFTVTATNANGDGPASDPSAAVTPRATIFDFATPAVVDGGDPGAINVGVRLSSDVAGAVTGIRFFKAPTNVGTHVGQLWTAGGQLLGQAAFSDESASGWQAATFDDPVPIAAGTPYIASYHAPDGHYSYTAAQFASVGVDNPPLHALRSGVDRNGVYAYGGSPGFPSSSYNATNYWVDVLFTPAQ